MILKCKICGGTLSFNQGDKIAVCDYCGREQTLPSGNVDEKVAILYERANSYRLVNEFDKAANIYNQIIAENPKDGEAYWNLALCNYGVVYVKDPKSLEYIPTCNRTQYLSILHDENYKNALKYATAEQCAIYEKDAHYINEVQKGIIDIAKREKPFDIFICYKETTAEGRRTRDSIKAQELYEELTAQGYKVFFSRITLESKIGTEYEPYIYAALASSKVMIHITSSGENSDAVWVKNEWSRYLALAAKDGNKTFIPIYFNMEKTELPDEFENIASYDMQKEGFQQELIRGIKKLIPTPIMKLQRRKKRRKVLGITGLIFAVCVAIGVVVSIPKIEEYKALKKEYDAAMQLYYDKEYPQAAWAFTDLGTFKDSEEMKKSAEKSWRLNLANVAMLNAGNGAYYVSANGTINTFDYNPGNAHRDIQINEHGKIVSIGGNTVAGIYDQLENDFLVLYEDGYVNSQEWNDIIQISEGFNGTHIALRANGTLVCEKEREELWMQKDNEIADADWLSPIEDWENIVSFYTHIDRLDDAVGIYMAYVVGLTADGRVHMVSSTEGYYEVLEATDLLSEWKRQTEFVKNLDNVKAFSFVPGYNGISMTVLTKDDKLLSYPGGDKIDVQTANILSIRESENGLVALKSNGEFVNLQEGKTILSDVVYINNMFVVTRSGTIYRYSDAWGQTDEILQTEGKTRVYNEWLERLE